MNRGFRVSNKERADERPDNVLAALERVAGDAAIAADAEAALWCITRTLPSLLGNPDAAQRPGALPEGAAAASAATVFLVTPDRQYHIIAAPVNFQPEQYHERVPTTLGHPGHVAATRRGAMLADTGHHQSFVKILQTFRAASAPVVRREVPSTVKIFPYGVSRSRLIDPATLETFGRDVRDDAIAPDASEAHAVEKFNRV
jgi:hypothetical protein